MHPSERVWRERGLLHAVLAGDESAWAAWYHESYESLYAYAMWRCGGLRDRADEVVQETWLTAVRRLRAFDPEQGTFAAWLRGIAANVLRNHLRKERRRPLPASAPAANGTPQEDLERRERAERVARALASLPGRYESALRAKYLEGRAVADIAAGWGQTPKAVESLLTRARAAFRAAFLETE
jgi:RNA polymerase sigma-70 factor (ECF subfamily)